MLEFSCIICDFISLSEGLAVRSLFTLHKRQCFIREASVTLRVISHKLSVGFVFEPLDRFVVSRKLRIINRVMVEISLK